jgi:hypothetical protein
MTSILTTERREQLHHMLDEVLDGLPVKLEQLDEAEQKLQTGMQRLATASMEGWAETASTASPPPKCPGCGQPMRHRGLVHRTLVTIHGMIGFARPRRRCDRCEQERYPLDERLCFESHGVSWRVAAKVSRLGSLLPSYDLARQLLAEDYGIELSKHSIEQIVFRGGEMLLHEDDAVREACFADTGRGGPRGPKEAAIRLEIVAVYADGTMIHTEGDWREIRVGRVIAWDAEGQRLRQRTFARFLTLESFGQQLFVEAHAAGYGGAKKRVFLGDGAHWLWELAALHFPEATRVLDWYHLSEKVHEAANAVFGEGTEESKTWAKFRLDELWEGQHRSARQAVAELRGRVRSKAKREPLRQLGVYLKNNAERMDYSRYRAEGLPIGSGPVESACKTLVGGRCKQAGMRNWRRRGAEAVLRFRAAQIDEEFCPLWDARLRRTA